MSIIKNILSKFGYQIVKKQPNLEGVSRNRAENFPKWLDEANAAGKDVNDFINSKVGNPTELLEKIVYPYFTDSTDTVIEVGPGTGRFSREILKSLSSGRKETVSR